MQNELNNVIAVEFRPKLRTLEQLAITPRVKKARKLKQQANAIGMEVVWVGRELQPQWQDWYNRKRFAGLLS